MKSPLPPTTSSSSRSESSPSLNPAEQALSVSELNNQVKQILEQNYDSIWITGELSNLSMPSSGHWYFTLKDRQAQIRGAMFRFNNQLCKQKPKVGDQVLVRGRLSLYTARGDYQIIVDRMNPAGIGTLQQAFEALKSQLMQEGLFDEATKRPIPQYPTKIGIITSPTGAALRDMLHVLNRRYPFASIIIYPCSVQGNSATPEVIQAIQSANTRKECDVLILGRGGGSIEDLWCFNEESVARAIYRSTLPIVSGIGHQTDFTIADFVADARAPTPSAAAELVSPDQYELISQLAGYESWFIKSFRQQLATQSTQLAHINKRLKHPGQHIEELSQRADDLKARLVRAAQLQIRTKQPPLKQLSLRLKQHSPSSLIAQYQQHLQEQCRRINTALKLNAKQAHQKWTYTTQRLHLVSPLATLERGYSITEQTSAKGSNSILRCAQTCRPGDLIKTRLHQGEITSIVQKTSSSSRKVEQ